MAADAGPDGAATASSGEPDEPTDRGARRGLGALLIALAVGAALLVGIVVVADASQDAAAEVVVEIPQGAAADVDEGVDPGVVGVELEVKVGELLVVRNDDDELHVLGALSIAPGDEVEQTFPTAGRYRVVTSLNPAGTVTIVVDE